MTYRFMTTLFVGTFLSLTACASAPASPAATPKKDTSAAPQTRPAGMQLSQSQRFEAWKADFIGRAIAKGYDPEMVRRVIMPARINEKALDRDREQPEFTKPIWVYVDNAANPTRLSGGKTKLAQHADLYAAVEGRYFVDRHILTAIWGLESAYGKIMGDHDIISALSTFAFEGRRTVFGERELFGVLDGLKSGYVRPAQLKGSWAGAMGMMQFIPTTYRDYAVDFDNDGNRDIWTNPADALGSAAHYLSRHGWRWQEPVFAEVRLPHNFDYSLSGGGKKTVNQWTALGVQPIDGGRWSPAAGFLEAKLLVPAGGQGPKFLTFKNFDVIKKYNNSTSYAMGINVLALGLADQPGIRAVWPKSDIQLSRSQKEAMQRKLTALGYDTKGVDGQIGPNTRRAIRAWQRSIGIPADGYVESRLFGRLMAQ